MWRILRDVCRGILVRGWLVRAKRGCVLARRMAAMHRFGVDRGLADVPADVRRRRGYALQQLVVHAMQRVGVPGGRQLQFKPGSR